ncbi:MAG: hypothetical protein FJ126_12740 [Deltaproteobacteria bacterium]|nr:hypothetical protein [Deltaproteobacteria bacterium]
MKDWLASLGRNKGLKLLALLLALALWFLVGSEERTETTLNLALDLANVPNNLVVASEVPAALQVRVNGPGSLVRKLTQSRPSHTLDLSGYKAGRHNFALGPKSFNFPRGIMVTRVQPNSLKITLVPTITRVLQIQPRLEGKLPEGLEVKNVQVRPPLITVTGPSSELADLKFLSTLPLDLGQLTESATVPTDVDFKNLHLTPKEQVPILAEIAIGPKEVSRTFTGVPVTAGPRPARLTPSQVVVTVRGPAPALKDLKAGAIKAAVDTKNLSPGKHRLKVAVQLPNGLSLQSLKPDHVTAQVSK